MWHSPKRREKKNVVLMAEQKERIGFVDPITLMRSIDNDIFSFSIIVLLKNVDKPFIGIIVIVLLQNPPCKFLKSTKDRVIEL